MHPILESSDKAFWHGYVDFYERNWQGLTFKSILEIGVLRGNSIRWLSARFPDANIVGIDILPTDTAWPQGPQISYAQVDQGDRKAIREVLQRGSFDLIIEDGSHMPCHQALALVEGMAALRPGGMYVLEDIHTSHPAHDLYKGTLPPGFGTALSLLLAIDHCRRAGVTLNATLVAQDSLFAEEDVTALDGAIGNLSIYRRGNLPTRCWHCGGTDFVYRSFQCACGVPIYAEADSMTAVLRKR